METHIFRILAISFALFGCIPVIASVPLRWTVETSRAQTAQFDAYHGETLDLAASFQSYGKPLAVNGQASLYYQTNGMDAAWWTAPASVSSNTISATFAPALDPGARVLNCFLGGTSSNYRAAFRLRFAESPGATPNLLPLPTVSYDARLNGTPTINGTNLIDYVVAAWEKQPNHPQSGTDEADVKRIIDAEVGGTNLLVRTTGGRAKEAWKLTDGTNTISADLSFATNGVRMGYWVVELTNHTPIRLVPEIYYNLWRDGNSNSFISQGDGYWNVAILEYTYVFQKPMTFDPFAYTNSAGVCTGYYVPETVTKLALKDAVDLKQHALPYPTNAIPGSVVSGYVNRASEAGTLSVGNFSLYMLGGMTMGTWYVHDSRGYSELATYASAGQIATNVYNSMPSTYAATNAVVALNQSVQYAVANGSPITITPPSAVSNGIRDWVLYLNGTAETHLNLDAFAGLFAADAAYTNAVASNVVTVFYFSEITNGVFHLSRQELQPVK